MASDKVSAADKLKERRRKQGAIKALLIRLKPDEVYVALRVILAAGHINGAALETFLGWMHPSAKAMVQTCAALHPLEKQALVPTLALE